MEAKNGSNALTDKLSAPLAQIIEQHRGKISALLDSGGTSTLAQALVNDDNVRKVASFCYPLLPGLVRVVVKEAMFVNFVMQNREKLLAQLTLPKARAA